MPLEVARTYLELIQSAKDAASKGEWDVAARHYERAIKAEPNEEFPYRRLMIIYRKLYRFEDELRIIEKGISAFRNLHEEKSARLLKKNTAVKKLSQSLAKTLGLTDNKGNNLFEPEPIESWLKRKQVVEKKLGVEKPVKKSIKKKTAPPKKSTAIKKSARRNTKSKK